MGPSAASFGNLPSDRAAVGSAVKPSPPLWETCRGLACRDCEGPAHSKLSSHHSDPQLRWHGACKLSRPRGTSLHWVTVSLTLRSARQRMNLGSRFTLGHFVVLLPGSGGGLGCARALGEWLIPAGTQWVQTAGPATSPLRSDNSRPPPGQAPLTPVELQACFRVPELTVLPVYSLQ